MRNKAINTLKYTGIVTLSQYIGTKKVNIAQRHNTGGSSLFEFFADCLIGDFTMAKATMPTKIMLVKRTESKNGAGNVDFTYEDVSGFIYLLTKPEKVYNSAGSAVRYSFVIPKDMLESINNFEGLGLGLYTDGAVKSEPENFAAFCELNLSKSSIISASLVIDWELIISNNASNDANQ